MNFEKKLLLSLPILCVLSSFAAAQDNNSTPDGGAIIPIREQILHMDRNLAKAGGVPQSVLKIDEQLLTIPLDSPKAIPLEKQKTAAMNAHSIAVQKGLEKAQAERAKYPPTQGRPQPVEQGQRMCSVNNGSATYLEPC